MKKVAIIGTVGVPASYGGFETLVEHLIGEHCSPMIEYTVFCSSCGLADLPRVYKGARLCYVPLRANGAQSVLYDALSLFRCLRGYDVVLVLGVSGCVVLPLFRLLSSCRLIVNIDGVEWKRAKWGLFAKAFLRFSEHLALVFSDIIVADNQGIVDYISEGYRAKTRLIAYGSEHVLRDVPAQQQEALLQEFSLLAGDYSMSVCRIEPENNCELILEVFAACGRTLVYVGNWDNSDFGRGLKTRFSAYSNIHIHDPIYDLDVLFVLRSNSAFYVHGHSAGGTNPSLVEAMFCSCNVLAFDVVYNRATTEGRAFYFSDGEELVSLLDGGASCSCAKTMFELAQRRYLWSIISKQYEDLY